MLSFCFRRFFVTAWFLAINRILLFAVNPGGEIQGIVKDSLTDQGIEYASVAIYNQSDSSLVTGTITGQTGEFIIHDVASGLYFLQITCLGYRETIIREITADINHKQVDVGEIYLNIVSEDIGEIIVQAERNPVEYHIDKDVINVSANSNNPGGMITEILNTHPAMETSLDGTIKFRGSTNFIVLIDGKPLPDESTEILNRIPASTIDKIEIITNPSARYDANHASGILNLITKKNKQGGFSGIFNATVSNAERHNADISANYRIKKINVSVHADAYHSPIFQDRTSEEERIIDGQQGFQNFHSDNILLWEGKGIHANIDYYVSTKNTASVYVNRSSTVFGWSPQKTITEGTSEDTSYYKLDDYMRNYREAWHVNVNDLHRFNEEGHQISIDANVIIVNMSRINDQYLHMVNSFPETGVLAEEYILRREQDITRQQYKADYAIPFGAHNKLETGLLMKSDNRTIENDIITSIISENIDVLNTDKYEAYNNLYAFYTIVNQKVFKTDIQTGLRIEYADRNTVLLNGNFSKTYRQLDFFPGISINRKFNNDHQFRISYNRSVWRPTDLQLNPTIYFRDISGEFSGNAELRPSYTNSLEMKYTLHVKGNSISLTAFYNHMKNNIITVRYLTEDSVYRNNPENLQGIQKDIGIEFSGDFNVFKWLTVNPSGKLYNGHISGHVTNQEIERRTNVWSVRIITNIKPYKNGRFQINTYYNSPTLGGQFHMEEIYGISMSFSQQFFKNKLIVSLSGNDILCTEKRKFIIEGDNFKQKITDNFPKHPVFSVSLTYKLNNFSKKQRENVEQGIGFF